MSILFIAFFFLKEQGLFLDALQAIVPSKYEKEVIHALDDSSRLLRRYFVGVSIQVTTITIFVSLVLTVFGMKNALLIAFFAALINVIPYLGPVIGATFGVLITISSNLDLPFYEEMLPLIFIVIITFAAMQFLDNFVLQPFIFSNSVSAHPLEIFIVILVGAKLSGIVGMVLAIPVYTVIRVIAKSFLSEFRLVQKLTKKL
jgi:predicted PurR-regulated permease PerM